MKAIQNFKNYCVTPDGKIWSNHSNKFISTPPNIKLKYLQAQLWKNNKGHTFYVHRLVATHYIPNPNNYPEVNHKDLNRTNNDVTNLEWTTRKGNSVHAIANDARKYSNRLTRSEFMILLLAVLAGSSYQSLVNNGVPYKVPFLSVKLRKIAKEEGLEEELDISLSHQRLERALKNLP